MFLKVSLLFASFIKQSDEPVTQSEVRAQFASAISALKPFDAKRRFIGRILFSLLEEGEIESYPNILDMRRKYYIGSDAE